MVNYSFYNVTVALAVALGSLTYGYSIAALANAQGKPSFWVYMKLDPDSDHGATIRAWWNCIIYAGGFFGSCSYSWFATRWGRRMPLALGALLATLGTALQAGGVNPEIVIVARAILGLGTGFFLPGVPLYQAEIAPPSGRGIIVGLHASLIGLGMSISSWIGVAFFHAGGNVAWRGPLAIHAAFPFVLFVVLWFVPESPRWLQMNNRPDDALNVLIRLHRKPNDPSNEFAHKEMYLMKAQIDHEGKHSLSLMDVLKTPSIRKRFIVGWLAMSCTQVSGLIVVFTYQDVIYTGLGFSNFMTGILASIFCVIGFGGNFLAGFTIEYVGRVRQIGTGLLGCTVCLTILCVLTKKYAGTDNRSGNVAATVFTYLLHLMYTWGVECACFIYTSELFPAQWRAIGVSTSITGVTFWACIFAAVGAPAFQNIGPLYYIVFICCSAVMTVVAFAYFPETKGFSLEQIAAVFGDEVVNTDGNVEPGETFVKEHEKIDHVEHGEAFDIESRVPVKTANTAEIS